MVAKSPYMMPPCKWRSTLAIATHMHSHSNACVDAVCCRLSDVYHVQGSPRCTEDLLRANADTAAAAVVLLPWSQDTAAADVDDILSAGMVDAGVLSVVRRLRALNPHVQVKTASKRAWLEARTLQCNCC